MSMPSMMLLGPRSSGMCRFTSYFQRCSFQWYLSRPSIAGLRKQWCPEVVDLLENMWAQDPRDRPTMSQVVITLKELVATY